MELKVILADAEDLIDLREAKVSESGTQGLTLDQAKKELGL